MLMIMWLNAAIANNNAVDVANANINAVKVAIANINAVNDCKY